MRSKKQEICLSTLDIMVKEIQVPHFGRVRKQIKNNPSQKLIYDERERFDEIREAVAFFDPYLKNCDLADAHADFIQKLEPFTVICHLTFKSRIHRKQVESYFFRFVRNLNEEFICKRYRNKKLTGIAWVRVICKQKRGVFHIHCLLDHPNLSNVSMARIRRIWHSCGAKVGKINQFKRYDTGGNIRYYLANHVHKNATIDYSKKLDWKNRAHRGQLNLLSTANT